MTRSVAKQAQASFGNNWFWECCDIFFESSDNCLTHFLILSEWEAFGSLFVVIINHLRRWYSITTIPRDLQFVCLTAKISRIHVLFNFQISCGSVFAIWLLNTHASQIQVIFFGSRPRSVSALVTIFVQPYGLVVSFHSNLEN